ncbi:MAG: TonB-dependent receptor [Cellvibrionaceae bacterium]
MKLNPIYRGIMCCTLAIPGAVMAQGSGGEAIEEIVVTGSLIRGSAEDAALPVEVHTAEDMRLSGSPSALEFAKSLTTQGPISGESYYFGGAGLTGNVSYNLRGIGADKTLSLFNGRRVAQNTSIIPSIALQRVEILKDGAAVTYGADATGGVVNFITRNSYEGFEVDASYQHIDGSEGGDYGISMMGGFGGDNGNVMWAAEWEHRSELDADERDFTSLAYGDNPMPWSTLTNNARWFAHGAPPAIPTPALHPLFPAPIGEYGTLLGVAADFDQDSCEAVGGIYAETSCNYGYLPYYKTVSDQDIYRLYGQATANISDSMEFYLRAAYSQVHIPHQYGSPSQPVVRGPALVEGLVGQFYVPRANPHWDEFAERSGLDQEATYPFIQGATAITYRAFAHGGNDVLAGSGNYSVPSEIENKYWHLSTGLNGEFGNDIGYDFGLTLNQTRVYGDSPDIIAYRLQEALNGFGGPNCDVTGLDLDEDRFGTQNPGAAGQNGCEWYNPFASNFAGQPVLGLANPSYGGPDSENSADLVRWLFDDRASESTTNTVTVDFVLDGQTPVELPGGNLAWAAGLQLRNTQFRESVESDFYNGKQPCVWPNEYGQVPTAPDNPDGTPNPDYNGCTPDEPGPFQFFGTNEPTSNRQDQRSVFGELNLPVLDTLEFTLAARHEEFSGDLDATVYKVSSKWQATDAFGLRASYGTNYDAPAAGITPGNVTRGVNSYTVAGGNWLGATTVTQSGIEPETATVWGVGAIWQSQGFTADHDLQIILDYFNIETEDEIGLLASANDIANAVFSLPGGLADCSHALISRVEFNGGVCNQGATDASDFANITTDFGNGPGQTTAGFDLQARYSMPFMAGDLSFALIATRVIELENTETKLDGYTLDDGQDRLGYANFATIGNAAPEWRGNFTTNYAWDIHNFRLVLNYVSGVTDERYELRAFQNEENSLSLEQLQAARGAALTPGGFQPGTDELFYPSYYGVHSGSWLSADFHYSVELPWDATLNASIQNISDEDPPEARQEFGYDPRMGNPLGRTFKLGFQKRF